MAKQLDKNNLGYLDLDFQYKLAKIFVEDSKFFEDVAPIVDQNAFTDSLLRTFVGTIKDYYTNFLFNTLGDDGNTSAQTLDYTIDNSYSPDTPYWTGTEWTAIPTDTELEAQVPTTVYLKTNNNWKVDNAIFAAYFFGNGYKWVSMTDEDGDGIYECVAPAGYPNVIFCRMDPGATENNWENVWNQTNDLVVPSSVSETTCMR